MLWHILAQHDQWQYKYYIRDNTFINDLVCFLHHATNFRTTHATRNLCRFRYAPLRTTTHHYAPLRTTSIASISGWANAGWHRPAGFDEVQTPVMDALVKGGIELDQAYSYQFCSPTRSSLQSGRLPTHVNVENMGQFTS